MTNVTKEHAAYTHIWHIIAINGKHVVTNTDRKKCNCSVKIMESRASRVKDIELGSFTFL